MTRAARKLTFEEYLTLNAEDWVRLGLPEGRCEFVDGEIVQLPFEDRINAKTELFLLTRLASVFPEDRLCCKDTEIEVRGSKARTRVPDLMLLSAELAAVMGDGRSNDHARYAATRFNCGSRFPWLNQRESELQLEALRICSKAYTGILGDRAKRK